MYKIHMFYMCRHVAEEVSAVQRTFRTASQGQEHLRYHQRSRPSEHSAGQYIQLSILLSPLDISVQLFKNILLECVTKFLILRVLNQNCHFSQD